jgi:hypothetical protein
VSVEIERGATIVRVVSRAATPVEGVLFSRISVLVDQEAFP